MNDQKNFMQEAIHLAVENVKSGSGGPFGAVIVKEGKIIARGVNRVTGTNDPTAHAEVVAIRAACRELGSFELTGCEIYCSCEPCPMCLGAIYWARPAKIYYAATKADAATIGFDDAFIYAELDKPHGQRQLPIFQMLREEALSAFDLWRQSVDKITY